MTNTNQDTLQWLYGITQQLRGHFDRMDEYLLEGKTIQAYLEISHMKTAIHIQMSQLFQMAERLGIEIKTYSYKNDERKTLTQDGKP